jgi:KilA-N domain.
MAKKEINAQLNAQGLSVEVLSTGDENDYISLTDIAKYKNPESPADIIKNWMRTRNTIEFLGIWERLNNPCFKLVEFDQFKTGVI